MKKIMNKFEQWSTVGVKVPFFHDAATGKPSITLIFPYVAFIGLLLSLIYLHINPSVTAFGASGMTFFFWVTATVLYKMRKLDKMKFDLDDKSLELQNGENK